MVFIDRFTPLDYQNKSEYNQHVLTERYNAAKSLRESYSNMYQEVTLLRDSLQDYRAKQDNQPELQMSEEDRIRYNNMIEDRYLAIKSIQENTTYSSKYGNIVRPFLKNNAEEQIKLSCQYMLNGSRHLKQYHLGRVSGIRLAEVKKNGERLLDYNSNQKYISNRDYTIEINDVSRSSKAIVTTKENHNLKKGDNIFIGGIDDESMVNINNQRFLVGEIISKLEFYLKDNNDNFVNSTNYNEFDSNSNSDGYILPNPDETLEGFKLIEKITKDTDKALITTTKRHNFKDGDYIKLRGILDQHNESIQSTNIRVRNKTRIIKGEDECLEIITPSEFELQNSFKVGDNVWLSDSNSNLDRKSLTNIGIIKYISTPNSIIFKEPIYQTGTRGDYIYYSSLDSKDSSAQITKSIRSQSSSIYVDIASKIPNNSYIVAKSLYDSKPRIIGVANYSYLNFAKSYFYSNLKPGETNYVTTSNNICNKLIEGSIIYSSNNFDKWVARVISINGDTTVYGNLKIENLSDYNLKQCPIYLTKVKLHHRTVDCLKKEIKFLF